MKRCYKYLPISSPTRKSTSTTHTIFIFQVDSPPTLTYWIDSQIRLAIAHVFSIILTGKVLGAVIALLGIGLFALPAGVLASGFVEEVQINRTTRRICPYCGREID